MTTTMNEPLVEAVCWALLLAGDKTHTRADVARILADVGSLAEADPSPSRWTREYLASRGAGVAD